MRIEHKNCPLTYLSDMYTLMEIKAHAEGRPSSRLRARQPFQSLNRHQFNLCLMLELFDECLIRFEKTINNKEPDYGAYSEAMCFLDAIYLFFRMLLDSVAGIVRHHEKFNNPGHELNKSFNELFKKSAKGKLPDNLNEVFAGCETWFPKFRERRDDIVHHYETYLLGFGKNSEGKTTVMQFSPRKSDLKIEDLRSYIGEVMAGYQCLIDRLLDYWDRAFNIHFPRNLVILEGRMANILWWAHRYGEYRNDNMVVIE